MHRMGMPEPRTMKLIDAMANIDMMLRSQLAADGRLCETDQLILSTLTAVKHELMQMDEDQLDLISALRYGRLNDHRRRRRKRLQEFMEWERSQIANSDAGAVNTNVADHTQSQEDCYATDYTA